MSTLKQGINALCDRIFKRYFDQLHDRLLLAVKAESSEVHTVTRTVGQEVRETLQQAIDETRGQLMVNVDETRGQLMVNVDETRGQLMVNVDETRGQLQADVTQARDEAQGETARFRHAFEDFRVKVEPRVVAIEARLDSLELRIMTLESEQQDYEKTRSHDLAAVRKEAASLRSDVQGDIVELTRMLRMQGDASDQVAEALGRTIARLSAEVETLGGAIDVRVAKAGAPGPS